MRAFMAVVISIVLSGSAFAQELLPELAGPAGKYKAAVESLEKQRLAEAGRASQAYLGTLEQVGKTATDKGEVKVIEAAAKERASALDGKLPPELPSDLPALRLQGARKALLMKLDKINANAAAKKKRFDGQYLGMLAALAAKAWPESALGKQVAAEREAVLAGAKTDGSGGGADGGGAKEVKVARGKNVVVNGDFEKVDADGKPEGWEWGGSRASVVSENGNKFIRVDQKVFHSNGTAAYSGVKQQVLMADNPKNLFINARLRTTNAESVVAAGSRKVPSVVVSFLDEAGNVITYKSVYWDKNTRNRWQKLETTESVPAKASKAQVLVSNMSCPGQIDFDDVEVTFK